MQTYGTEPQFNYGRFLNWIKFLYSRLLSQSWIFLVTKTNLSHIDVTRSAGVLFPYLNVVPFNFKGKMNEFGSVRKLHILIVPLVLEICHLLLWIWLWFVKVYDQGAASIQALALDFCFVAPPALGIFASTQHSASCDTLR